MNFDYTPEQEAFRQEVRVWLEENLPEGWGTPEYKTPETLEEQVELSRWWQRKLYEGGWAGLNWPKEYGGRGATLMERLIFNEEQARHDAPEVLNVIGVGLAGPTIIRHGTEEQKKRYLQKILNGEEIWCQGFSEPNAGSDLASLSTRAVEDGDDYVINGQKVWTSRAHYADFCILLARTDTQESRHRGISYFIVDMKFPGITIRPLVQITGDKSFNEVFLDDLRVPKGNMVGEKNKGWYVAMTTLMHERAGAFQFTQFFRALDKLVELAKKTERDGRPLSEDPVIRQKLAQLYIELNVFKYSGYRSLTKQLRGEPPGPEGSGGKLFITELNVRMMEVALEIEGPYSQLVKGSPYAVDDGVWQYRALFTRGYTIAGGTSEIQKNIIAHRILGLPR